jgi:DNA-binding CsgD family transcriptional regulator
LVDPNPMIIGSDYHPVPEEDVSVPSSSDTQPGSWPLVGRDAVLDQLCALLSEPGRTIVVVDGEHGIGKTRLLAEVAARARAAGMVVRTGRASRRSPTVAADALRDTPADLGLTEPSGLLLIIDDVHWADAGSLDRLGNVISSPPSTPLVMLIGCRAGQLPPSLGEVLEHLQTGLRWLRLGPLPAADVDLLLPHQTPTRRRLLYRASGGNPRYLSIIDNASDQTLTTLDPWLLDDQTGAALDRAITGELRGLAPTQRQVMHAAAVLGADVDLELVADVAELAGRAGGVATAHAVDGLVAAGLLHDRAGRLEFPHALLRAAAYRLTGPGELRLTHQRAADCLRRRGAPPPSQAVHLEHCAELGDTGAAETLMGAARTMLGREPATSVRWLRMAQRVLPHGPELASRRSWLRVLLAKALVASGQLAKSRDELRDLRDLSADARPSAVRVLATTSRLLGDVPTARALASSELGRAGGAHTDLHFELLIDELLAGHEPHANTIAGRLGAGLDGRHPGLPAVTAALRTLNAVANAGLPELIGRLDEAVAMVDGLDDGTLCDVLDVLIPLGWVELMVDRGSDTLRHVERGLRLANRYGQRHVIPQLLPLCAAVHNRMGSITEALRAADDAVATARSVGSVEMVTFARMTRLRPLWLRDGDGAATEALAEIDAAPRLSSTWHRVVADAGVADVLLGLGRPEDCQARLRPWLTTDAATLGGLSSGWCALLGEAYLAGGDLAEARRWSERASRQVTGAPLAGQLGAVAHVEASLLLAEGNVTEAVSRARAATEHYADAGLVVRTAQARWTLADALVRDGQAARARHELGAVRRALTGAGADSLAAAAERAQRQLTARLPRARRSPRPAELTAREREVAELVAQGLTNRAIADTLFLSPRTVDAHLGRILTKLGIPNRAAVARRLGSSAD